MDHSEILNYEFEMANKARTDHMNLLVYKSLPYSTNGNDQTSESGEWDKENAGRLTSTTLFKRLAEKEL